ncbi:MAG: (2Fe-2S) ferredoxin domain-containing protein [Elusimicrobia bacterium]|nr:(2Fe-2S) ferredoxin domain-containing protein [Elusimicrobiota bacterium]
MERREFPYQAVIFICTNAREGGRVSCANPGRDGAKIREALKSEVHARDLRGKVRVCSSGCMDLCELGPNVMVFTGTGERVWYRDVSLADVPKIVEAHFPHEPR